MNLLIYKPQFENSFLLNNASLLIYSKKIVKFNSSSLYNL